jgi:acyl-CoA reductase-like NAD-dependent aldehyde dehydrogenase
MAELIDANRDALARIETRDNGKATREIAAELEMIVRYFEYFAGVCQNVLGHTMPEAGPFLPTPAASRSAWSARSFPGTRRW